MIHSFCIIFVLLEIFSCGTWLVHGWTSSMAPKHVALNARHVNHLVILNTPEIEGQMTNYATSASSMDRQCPGTYF